MILDVNGIGYEIEVPMTTLYRLPAVGEPVTLHTHLVVREDAAALCSPRNASVSYFAS